MKASDYQDIGQYLRESRESLKVTCAQAAADLHIRAKYLMALETGDLNELPGKAYIRGYIRNYAQYLRLDVEEVLDAYAMLLAPRAQELFNRTPTLQQNLPSRQLLWLSLAGFALLYVCWYVAFYERAAIREVVASLPAGFAHLLDKTPAVEMDKPWQDCLSGSDEGCFILLYAHSVIPPDNMILYDIHPDNIPPQNP